MEQLTEFVTNNLILFAALLGVMVLLIKAELEHQANKGMVIPTTMAVRLMNGSDDALILDVRPSPDYKSGHIKGAKNVPLSDFESGIEKFSDYKNKPVLVYCNSGNTIMRAIKILKKAGFEKVNSLEGGIIAWKEAKLPLSR